MINSKEIEFFNQIMLHLSSDHKFELPKNEIFFNFFHPFFSRKLLSGGIDLKKIFLGNDVLVCFVNLTNNFSVFDYKVAMYCLFDEISSLISYTKLNGKYFTSTLEVKHNNSESNKTIQKEINLVFIAKIESFDKSKYCKVNLNCYLLQDSDSLTQINFNGKELNMISEASCEFKIPKAKF